MKTIHKTLPLFIILFLLALPLQAQEVAAVKDRIKERTPAVDALKMQGQAGEDSRGYLAPRGTLSAEENALLAAANNDRKILYSIVAAKTGIEVESVGKQRARQIAKRSAKGIWLQKDRGNWYQKQ